MSYFESNAHNMSVSQYMSRSESARAASADKPNAVVKLVVEPFKPPPIESDRDAKAVSEKAESVRQFIASIPGMRAANAIGNNSPGIVLPAGYSSPVVINPMMNFTSGTHDGLVVSQLQLAPLDIVPQAFKDQVVALVNTHYLGSGSVAGLFRRMKAQIHSKVSPSPTEEELSYILTVLPHRPSSHLLGDGLTIQNLDPVLNLDAHPGAPYFKSGVTMGDVLEKELVRAQQYLSILSTGGASALHSSMAKNPMLATMILCPKKDIYLRTEYFTKTRPFGVVPGALRILFACLAKSTDDGQENFLDNPLSISAFRFSWANGGAEKLWNHIIAERPAGFYPLSWGDDQLWVVVLEDGTTFVLTPDVMGMDMKLDQNTFAIGRAWLYSQYSTAPLTLAGMKSKDFMRAWVQDPLTRINPEWLSAASYMMDFIQSHLVLMYKHYVFAQTKGLLSGLNLTTQMDIVASARIAYKVKGIPLPKKGSPSTIIAYVQEITRVCKDMGFPLKEATLGIQVIKKPGGARANNSVLHLDGSITKFPEEVLLSLTFLGMRLRNFEFPEVMTNNHEVLSTIVPFQDPAEILLRACYGSHEGSPEERAAKALAALIGQGFQGFTDPAVFEVLKNSFETRVKMGHRAVPGLGLAPAGFPEAGDAAQCSSYPTVYWFAQHFVLPETKQKIILSEMPPITGVVVSVDSISETEELEISEFPDFFASSPQPSPPIPSPKALTRPTPVGPTKPTVPPIRRSKENASIELPKPALGTQPASFRPLSTLARKSLELFEDVVEIAEPVPLGPVRPIETFASTHPTTIPPREEIREANRLRHLRKHAASVLALLSSRPKGNRKQRGMNISEWLTEEQLYEEYQDDYDESQEQADVMERQILAEADTAAQRRQEEEDEAAGVDDSHRNPFSSSDEDPEEEKYYDPTMSASKQSVNWSLFD